MRRLWLARLVLLLNAPAYLSSCYAWQAEPFPLPATASAHRFDARITLADGSQILVPSAQILGDTIHGPVGSQFRLSLSEVTGLERRRVHGPRTAAAIALTITAMTAVLVVTGGCFSGCVELLQD